ncbi:MAG: hypothetical protein MUF15_21595 [Acidobacteria bacterium]|jgi:hypothetical protein|nr:hypothetical protein [Acidobacteriota bacterium]
MGSEIILGQYLRALTQLIIDAGCDFSSNKVERFDKSILERVLKILPQSLQKVDSLFGLKLILQKKESMAHSGWLYSRYLEACKKLKIDSRSVVAIYKDDFFREFGQFDAMQTELFFIGFGESGKEMLGVIFKAESQFNPDDFDLDGYRN